MDKEELIKRASLFCRVTRLCKLAQFDADFERLKQDEQIIRVDMYKASEYCLKKYCGSLFVGSVLSHSIILLFIDFRNIFGISSLAWCLMRQVQIASQMPGNGGVKVDVAVEIARRIQNALASTPALKEVAERGWKAY